MLSSASIAVFLLCVIAISANVEISFNITADNAYAVYSGNAESVNYMGSEFATLAAHIFSVEYYPVGPGGKNSPTRPATPMYIGDDQAIYIVAWSDWFVQQGALFNFVINGIQITPNNPNWQVYPADLWAGTDRTMPACNPSQTAFDRNIAFGANRQAPPCPTWVQNQVAYADQIQGWKSPTWGPTNSGAAAAGLWARVGGIPLTSKWIWYKSSRCTTDAFRGCNHEEPLIFRIPATAWRDEPSAIFCNIAGPITVECGGSNTAANINATLIPSSSPYTWSSDCSEAVFSDDTLSPTLAFHPSNCGEICNISLNIEGKAVCRQQISVKDTTSPSLQGVPTDISLQCSKDVTSTPSVTATDNCDDEVSLNLSPVTVSGSCPNQFTIERTWNALDSCGNEATQKQTIVVNDIASPTLQGVPEDVSLECARDVPSAASVSAVDNCDEELFVSLSSVRLPGSCANQFSTTRTWNATDSCGNMASQSQTIVVSDTSAPSVVKQPPAFCLWPPNHKYYCFDDVLTLGPDNFFNAEDNCGEVPTVSFSGCVSSQCDEGRCTTLPDNGDGHTTNDCYFDATLQKLCVRAERAGTTGVRWYHGLFTVVDACGNSIDTEVKVFVPKSMSNHDQCLRANQ